MTDLTIKNTDYLALVLKENADNAHCEDLAEARNYVIECSENDPNFFRWLFGEDAMEWNDFECPDEAQQSWEDFMNDYF
jgi:hypothetical protein